MATPGEVRGRIERTRNVGKTLITIGLAAALFGAFQLSLDWQLIGATSPINCGTPLAPLDPQGIDSAMCGPTLREQLVVIGVTFTVAVGSFVAGVLLLVRNPTR